jgi:hypothetical protein
VIRQAGLTSAERSERTHAWLRRAVRGEVSAQSCVSYRVALRHVRELVCLSEKQARGKCVKLSLRSYDVMARARTLRIEVRTAPVSLAA